jgi:hypothetical protein
MRALASYIMRGRLQAISVVAVATVLSLILAPLSYLGAAAAGLVALRVGAREAGLVLAGATLVAGAISWAGLGSFVPVLGVLFSLWLPVVALALVLRATASQGLTFAIAGAVGILGVLLAHLLIDSPAAAWREMLDTVIVPALERSGMQVDPTALDQVAGMMTGLVAAVLVVGLVCSVLLARWWQALLYNPGGFATEFRALRLPRAAGFVAVAAMAASLAGGFLGTLGSELATIALAVFLFQGLAVGHAVVAQLEASVGWLVGIYVMLFLFGPPAAMALGTAGVVDVWMDLRARVASRSS